MSELRELLSYCSPATRRAALVLLLFLLLGAMAELVTIGAVVPLLSIAGNPAEALGHPRFGPVLAALGMTSPGSVLVLAAAVFSTVALAAGAIRIALVWMNQRFVTRIVEETSVALYRRVLHQPYLYHVMRNSSHVVASVEKAQRISRELLMPLFQGGIAAVIAAFILAGMVLVDPATALGAGLCFSAVYILVFRACRVHLRRNGAVISRGIQERVQAVNEGVGGIRDVLLDRSQETFVRRFAATERAVGRAQAVNAMIIAIPRFVMESIGLMLVVAVTLTLSATRDGLVSALPILGAMALGALRLLPLLQQVYQGVSLGTSGRALLQNVLSALRQPVVAEAGIPVAPLAFRREIVVSGVGFSYPNTSAEVLRNVSFVVPRGSRVGIVGRTGSGKSTLMDLLLGLLSPGSGTIRVDDVVLGDDTRAAWQAIISHVPQSIFLADATIAENIAFGIPPAEIDMAKVAQVARQAELDDVIAGLPEGVSTPVGERGVRLSGGQRQRIGIARALYRRAQVLVLDEATSALDTETEAAVMASLDKLGRDLTIFIIAHRLTTVERCDFLIRLCDGAVQIEYPRPPVR